jgi:hypothetical protein
MHDPLSGICHRNLNRRRWSTNLTGRASRFLVQCSIIFNKFLKWIYSVLVCFIKIYSLVAILKFRNGGWVKSGNFMGDTSGGPAAIL